jgi:hypothetical protein
MTRAGKERIAQEDRRIRIGELSVQIASADRSLTKEEIESRAIQMYEQERRANPRLDPEGFLSDLDEHLSRDREFEITQELRQISTNLDLWERQGRSSESPLVHRKENLEAELEAIRSASATPALPTTSATDQQPTEAISRNQQDIELPADNVGPPQAVSAPEAPAASPEAPEVPAALAESTPLTVVSTETPKRQAVIDAPNLQPDTPDTNQVASTTNTPLVAPPTSNQAVVASNMRQLEDMTRELTIRLDRVVQVLDNSYDLQERLYRASV